MKLREYKILNLFSIYIFIHIEIQIKNHFFYNQIKLYNKKNFTIDILHFFEVYIKNQ